MADPFIEQVKQLCRDHPVQAKWVLVPSAGLRWTLGERLLHEGCNWVNLRLVALFQLALDGAAPALLQENINPCPETLGPSLLQKLLLDLKSSEGYFRPLILLPGMAEALWSSLQQFRMAGLQARDLSPTTPKRQELRALFQAYEDYLHSHQLADRAIILQTHQTLSSIGPDDPVLIYPYHCWSRLEKEWLERLPGQRLMAQAPGPPPSGWFPRQVVPASAPPPQFFCATRRPDEVDEIARRLLQAGIPLDQVEIAAPLEDYGLIQDRMAAFAFPCTFDSGLAVLNSRPGQALDGLLRWLEQGCTAYHLRELLGADLLSAKPSSFKAARLLESAQISWGRHTYHPQLQALADLSQQRGLQSHLADIEALKEWLRTLFLRLPPPNAQDQIQPQVWLAGLQETLRLDFSVGAPDDDRSRQALWQALQELKMLPGELWAFSRFIPLVRQRLQSLRALATRPRPGHIHVTAPQRLGLSGRPHTFWIGMEEGRWFKAPPEDCVLSDQERAQLHPDLEQSEEPAQRRLFHIRERLLTLSGTLTMSYAQRDMAGDQEQLPAWIFLEAVRRQVPQIDTYQQLESWLGPPAQAQSPQPSLETVHQLYPNLARGALADSLRYSPEFTGYDGFVPAAAGKWDPRLTGLPISVSRLQTLASCPFLVFLENGLGVQRPPLQLPESDRWLDPATRGSVLHEVYAGYHRALRARGWKPDLERDQSLLHSLLDEQLHKVRAVLPAPSPALEKSERLSLKAELGHFLQLELLTPERRPIGLEVPFGMGPDALEPLAHAQPVVLDLGNGQHLPVRGRIDRIDQIDAGYAVVDYKTGRSLYTGSKKAVFDRGRLLQHALYALVVEQMLGAPGQVSQSSYYFPTLAAARPWNHFPYPSRDHFLRVLAEVLEPLRTGVFVATHQREKDCVFCPYQAACESTLDEASQAKLNLPANAQLHSRRRLLEEV